METFSTRADKLDLAIVMDCTGSMSNYTRIVRDNINKIVETIVAKEKGDVSLALVEYCHHHHSTFVSEPHNFTSNISEITEWLENCYTGGGDDEPEPIATSLRFLVNFKWRPAATKIAVLIKDAPPQGLDELIDEFPDDCPAGLDPLQIARDLAKRKITLYVVGCEPSLKPYKEFFTGLAYITGGQYVPLEGHRALTQIIIGGAQEELSLEQLMDEVNREVEKEVGEEEAYNLDDLAVKIYSKLSRKDYKVKKLTRNRVDVCQISEKAKTSEALINKDINVRIAEHDRDYSRGDNEYERVELSLDLEQVQRMVMKSHARTKHTDSTRADKLDLAIVMDCTGSMGTYIETATNNIKNIVDRIVAEKTDVRLALVEYRDHPPQDKTFVTKRHDFTSSISQMKEWLENCSADGGGDGPEAVADGLHDLLKLNWRPEATKIAILISDAPPHGLDKSCDEFPDGCPARLDPLQVARDLAKKEITLYVVGCEPSLKRYKEFFTGLAYITGGQYVPLTGYEALTEIVIGGVQEELSLERLMGEVNRTVDREILDCEYKNLDELVVKIHSKLSRKGYKVKKLTRNGAGVCQISEKANAYSEMNTVSEASEALKYKENYNAIDTLRSIVLTTLSYLGSILYGKTPADVENNDEFATFECVKVPLDREQVKRMVKKSLGRNHPGFSFTLRLDMAFVLDCTACIETATDNIKKIVDTIVAEKTDVSLALIEYRDHPPQDKTFVTKSHDFTSSISQMKRWLENCSADGGGDGPEAVADGLHDLLKLNWRPASTKTAILITDAPPHGLDKIDDGFPDGCPAGLDPLQIARELAKKEITLYVVGCEPLLKPYKEFFTGLAYITGGQYVPLAGYEALTQIIIGGALEELSLERLMWEVNRKVDREILDCEYKNLDELAEKIRSKLSRKDYKVKKLTRNGVGVCHISEKANAYSEMNTMSDASEALKCQENHEAALDSMSNEDVENNDEFPRYECVEVSLDLEQVKRMVKKSLARNHPGFSFSDKQPLKLDMAFVVDCTGSMSDYICHARNNIDKAVETITATETSDVRVALVEYCYHPPQHSTFVTKSHDFTRNISEMKQRLENGTTTLCGNNLKAFADSLHELSEMNWRPAAKKIAILLSFAPPHGLDKQICGFPEGLDPLQLVRDLAKKEITLFVVGCEPSLKSYRNFFMGLAYINGGQYLPLDGYEALTHIISGGVHEELSLERLMNKINRKVEKEIRDGKAYNVDDLARKIHSKLSRKGYKVKMLTRNGVGVCKISEKAKAYSKMNTMSEVSRADEDDDDVYVCVEQFLDLEQVNRMVKKISC